VSGNGGRPEGVDLIKAGKDLVITTLRELHKPLRRRKESAAQILEKITITTSKPRKKKKEFGNVY